MAKKRAGHKAWQGKRRAHRRFPFNSETRLSDLVKPKCYEYIRDLVESLRPYLQDVAGTCSVSKLYFDLDKISGTHKVVYKELARFLSAVTQKRGLKVSQSAFFRYLASPDHCNLGISEKSLKALITREMKTIC